MADAPLRIDWLEPAPGHGGGGRLGLTILPGKHGPSSRYPGRVYRRDVETDLGTLVAHGARRLVLLVEDEELKRWGDPAIVERAAVHGVDVRRHAMPDGGVPASLAEMDAILGEIDDGRAAGNVAVACMGGIGRSGLVAACWLVAAGIDPQRAIAEVRRVRHTEAVETAAQSAFVAAYAAHRSARDG